MQFGTTDPDVEVKRWPFCVEVKWRSAINPNQIDRFIAGKSKTLGDYWEHCVADAEKTGLAPLLVMRGNRLENGRSMPWWCVFPDWVELGGAVRVCLLDELTARNPFTFALPG